ncbi:GNAT family N-acetyltransferase [Nocardiopsis coralliicola]
MALWRIRTPVDDRPGSLAALVGAMADRGADIVALSFHTGAGGAVDEFVAQVPGDPAPLFAALGPGVRAVPAQPREVGDEATRSLLLAARLRREPNRLPAALAELLHADSARWTNGGEEEGALLVPVGPLRAVRVRRPEQPFTWTESARADAFVRSVLPPAGPVPTSGVLHLPGGAGISVAQVRPDDAEGVRRLHRRCSKAALRRRYLGSAAEPGDRMLAVFCDPERGLTLAARADGGEPVALAHLMYTLDPGVGETAFLVEDAWHGRDLGTALAGALVAVAADWGLAEVRAEISAENRAMLRIMHRLGAAVGRPNAGAVQARVPLAGGTPARAPGRLTALMTRPGAAGR